MTKRVVTDNLDEVLNILPPWISERLRQSPMLSDLVDIVLDLKRPPVIRFSASQNVWDDVLVSEDDIQYVVQHIGSFGKDNRAGLEGTLHRISCMRNRQGKIIGLTIRIGRAIYGVVDPLESYFTQDKSILLMGRPGVGKTTLLREVARLLSVDYQKRVIVVDTSNEIAGDGDVPHPAIGLARRMQVPEPNMQHDVMIEAVENHMPEVIIIDEIGRKEEVDAARTIAERGVQLIATAHGNTLENILVNPTLSDLVGGVQVVTLSDEEAHRRGTQKTILERKTSPTFDILIEIRSRGVYAIHEDVAKAVDGLLRGIPPNPLILKVNEDGSVERSYEQTLPPVSVVEQQQIEGRREKKAERGSEIRILPLGISRSKLEKAIANLGVPAVVVDDVSDADMVLTLRSQVNKGYQRLREAKVRNVPIKTIKSNTMSQMEDFLSDFFAVSPREMEAEIAEALQEAEEAAMLTTQDQKRRELRPEPHRIRRLQHELIAKYGLLSFSVGEEPHRHVVVTFPGAEE
ncbi:R3H domain-containing nucleic acid-binding protein [Coprothermobacter platensis]|uniref:R3H domain-containing nucleic acid-binding protein n=1 Tax=Coprothermobacter platensis TaxID=108819 RepID=UPI00036A322A|nr:R3H domain-containing nucleic acid-binding protein [Coprothermobacter platensis]